MRFSFALIILCLLACNAAENKTTSNLDAIKAILDKERKSHLTKDVDLLLGEGMDTVLEANQGIVRTRTEDDYRISFGRYFNSVDFIKWDDIAEPIFFFSADSTMAAVTVQKQVIVKQPNGQKTDTADYAWTSVFRKQNDRWKLIVITSTNK
jgi:hypothetical protein